MIYRFEKLKDARAARHEPEARLLLARIYWAALIILLAVICVASIGYGVWEFTRPLGAKASDVKVGTGKTVLQRVDLQGVLEGFDAWATRFEERRTAPVTARDPS